MYSDLVGPIIAIQVGAIPQHDVVAERRRPIANLVSHPVPIGVITDRIVVHEHILTVDVEMNARSFVVLDGVAAKRYARRGSDLDASRSEAGIEVGIVVMIDCIALDENA